MRIEPVNFVGRSSHDDGRARLTSKKLAAAGERRRKHRTGTGGGWKHDRVSIKSNPNRRIGGYKSKSKRSGSSGETSSDRRKSSSPPHRRCRGISIKQYATAETLSPALLAFAGRGQLRLAESGGNERGQDPSESPIELTCLALAWLIIGRPGSRPGGALWRESEGARGADGGKRNSNDDGRETVATRE